MMSKTNLLKILFVLFSYSVIAQIGIGTNNPHESAILEVKSTTKGFLPPRLTNPQIGSITPTPGLMVYSTFEKCLIVYKGFWLNMCTNQPFYLPPTNKTKLISTPRIAAAFLGKNISMSDDGSKIIAGAERENGANGAVYIYTFDGTNWDAGVRIQAPVQGNPADNGAELEFFGKSVAISGDGTKVIVGADYEKVGSLNFAGTAYIYKQNGTNWDLEKKIQATDPGVEDYFGFSVSMNIDGTKVVVGAYSEDTGGTNAGAVYVFNNTGGTAWDNGTKIQASDKATLDHFGETVSMNSDGSRIVVGSPGNDSGASGAGAAYIFNNTGGTTWDNGIKVQAQDKQVDDDFGKKIEISGDGSTIVISALLKDEGGILNTGAAYIFKNDGSTWDTGHKIISPLLEVYGSFGSSVAINNDGTKVVVGSSSSKTSANNPIQGAAYIFNTNGIDWTTGTEITGDPVIQGQLGISVAISDDGTRVAAGAYADRNSNSNFNYDGAVYIFD